MFQSELYNLLNIKIYAHVVTKENLTFNNMNILGDEDYGETTVSSLSGGKNKDKKEDEECK